MVHIWLEVCLFVPLHTDILLTLRVTMEWCKNVILPQAGNLIANCTQLDCKIGPPKVSENYGIRITTIHIHELRWWYKNMTSKYISSSIWQYLHMHVMEEYVSL